MEKIININLKDDETGLVYPVKVTSEVLMRLQKDIYFATKYLEEHKTRLASQLCVKNAGIEATPQSAEINSEGSSKSTEINLSTVPESAESAETNENDPPSNVFKWCHSAILLLVEEYRKQLSDLTSGKVSQRRFWNKISVALKEKGHDVSGPQCMSKFNGMKRTYKSIKDHNSKSGNNLRTWTYTEHMDSLLGEKPFMTPVAIASSSGQQIINSECSSSNSDIEISPSTSSRKRKVDKESLISEAIIKSREMAEQNKERHHQENMAQRDKFLTPLDEIHKKL